MMGEFSHLHKAHKMTVQHRQFSLLMTIQLENSHWSSICQAQSTPIWHHYIAPTIWQTV